MIFRLKLLPDRFFHYTVPVALGLLVMLLVSFAPDVQAQSQENLKVILERMGRLEKDIRNLNLSIARGAPVPAPTPALAPAGASPAPARTPAVMGPGGSHALARLSVQMTELENDLRAVTGSSWVPTKRWWPRTCSTQ